MRTSAFAASRRTRATPSGSFRLTAMPRLLRLLTRYPADSPSLCGGHVRDSPPTPGSSTLITSAPRSPMRAPQSWPASTRERSTTRMPSRDSGVGGAVGVLMCATILNMTRLADVLARRILVLDGAMGTMIQAAGLGADDFGGERYEGCNEHLNLTRPDVIRRIHAAYLDAGADVVSTNTFGCAPYVLAEYGLGERAYEIARAGAILARQAAGARFVLGAMGPGTRSISVTRNVTFDEVREAYAVQARGLIDGGVDALLLETQQDTLNVKAAATGVRRAMREAGVDRPLLVSGTIEPTGTMLAGQGVEALYVALEHLDLLSIGLNCATGPEFMTDHLRSLAAIATRFVTVYPNAGLPDERGQYGETPQSLAFKMKRFVDEGWVNLIGGCCGTTPAHIRSLADLARGRPARVPASAEPQAVSGVEVVYPTDDNRPLFVGERTNVIGSRRFKALIIAAQVP